MASRDVQVTVIVEYNGILAKYVADPRDSGNPRFAPKFAQELAEEATRQAVRMLASATGDIRDEAAPVTKFGPF